MEGESQTSLLMVVGLLWGLPLLGGLLSRLAFSLELARGYWATNGALFLAWLGSLFVWLEVAAGQRLDITLYRWLDLGSVQVDLGVRMDPLGADLTVLVTSVGLAAQLFCGPGADGRRGVLLGGMMSLALVLAGAPNFAQFLLAWIGLGLGAYWAAEGGGSRLVLVVLQAGNGMLAGAVFLVQGYWGQLDFDGLHGQISQVAPSPLIGFLLVGAALCAAAQAPLHFWLTAASRGPLPAVVLVQAGAVVPAGAVLLLRAGSLFSVFPQLGTGVVAVGLASGLLGAAAAFAARSTSAILAYSTTSQIGFVFVGIGLGAEEVAQQHLVAHGLVKTALLLVAARLVGAETGRGRLPLTFWFGFVAAWGLSGLPPSIGFWSQSGILVAVYYKSIWWLWIGVCILVALTGMYTFRLFFVEFSRALEGDKGRADPDEWALHRALPMVGLALFVGVVGTVDPLIELMGTGSWGPPGHGSGWPGTSAAAQLAVMVGLGLSVVGLVGAGVLGRRSAGKSAGVLWWNRFAGSGFRGAEGAERFVARPLVYGAGLVRDLVDTVLLELLLSRGMGLLLHSSSWLLDRLYRAGLWTWFVVAVLGGGMLVVYVLGWTAD